MLITPGNPCRTDTIELLYPTIQTGEVKQILLINEWVHEDAATSSSKVKVIYGLVAFLPSRIPNLDLKFLNLLGHAIDDSSLLLERRERSIEVPLKKWCFADAGIPKQYRFD